MDLSILSVRSMQDIPATKIFGGNSILQSYLTKEKCTNLIERKNNNQNIGNNSEVRTSADLCSVIPHQTLPKRKVQSDPSKNDTEIFSEAFERSLSFAGDAPQNNDEWSNRKKDDVPSVQKERKSPQTELLIDTDKVCETEPMDLSLPKVKRESSPIPSFSRNDESKDEDDIEVVQILNEESHLNQRRPRLSSDTLSRGLNCWQSMLLQQPLTVPQISLGGNHNGYGYGKSNPTMVNQNRHLERPVWPVRSTNVSKRIGHRSVHLCNDSYVAIIAEIILKSTEKRVLLRDIYEQIENNGVVMRTLPRSWKGIIRHRLTVNECFIKCSEHTGSYRHFWTIHPQYMEQFSRGVFTSARNVRCSSMSTVQHDREEEKEHLTNAIIKSKSFGDSEVSMKHRIQLSIPKLR